MTQPEPRYEFRIFDADLSTFAERLRTLGNYQNQRESSEIYLAGNTVDYNCKIRDERLEIKKRLAVERGLECWQSRLKASFPLSVEILNDELCPALALADCKPLSKCYDLAALLEELSKIKAKKIRIAQVHKRRTDYTLDDCQAEYVKLQIGQTNLQSIAVESPDAEQVLAALPLLGLDQQYNTSYPQAIATVDGDGDGFE